MQHTQLQTSKNCSKGGSQQLPVHSELLKAQLYPPTAALPTLEVSLQMERKHFQTEGALEEGLQLGDL